MKFKALNSLDVANYIVWHSNSINVPLTHLKLQKLLYYVVARFLKDKNQYLIDEPICKWQYGPVVKSVYHQFKIFGNSPVLEPVPYLSSDSNYSGSGNFFIQLVDVKQKCLDLDKIVDVSSTVAEVIENLKYLSAFDLVDRTHKEPAWKNFEMDILRGVDLTYSNDELSSANI